MNRIYFSFSLVAYFNRFCSLSLMCLMSLLVACGGTSEVAQLPGPSQPPQAIQPSDLASPKFLVTPGAQAMTAQLDSNCQAQPSASNGNTLTAVSFPSATLQITAAGDVIFSAIQGTATTPSTILRINDSDADWKLLWAQVPPVGFSTLYTILRVDKVNPATGRVNIIQASIKETQQGQATQSVLFITEGERYDCDITSVSNFVPFSSLITGQRLAQTFLAGVTSTGLQTATIANGVLYWDNWPAGSQNKPGEQNDQIRYVDLNLASGALSVSPSSAIPRGTSTAIPLFSVSQITSYQESYAKPTGSYGSTSLRIDSSNPNNTTSTGALSIALEKTRAGTIVPQAAFR
jgi:hypothetical protein